MKEGECEINLKNLTHGNNRDKKKRARLRDFNTLLLSGVCLTPDIGKIFEEPLRMIYVQL